MQAMTTRDGLAALLDYPDGTFPARLDGCLESAGELPADAASALRRFAEAVSGVSIAELQETYTETFDLDPGCTLDVGWHLFGERFERGAFLADLRPRLAAAGIGERNELPDFLPTLLRLLWTNPDQTLELRALVASAVATLTSALRERGSPYEHLVTGAFAATVRGE